MSPSATTPNGEQAQTKTFVRAYQPFDEEAVMHICRATAHESALQEPANSLVPIIFALPYVYLYPEYCFVVDRGDCAFSPPTAQFPNGAGTALGYVNGVPDSALYLRRIKEEYFPYLTSLDATRWQRPLPEAGTTLTANGPPGPPTQGGNEIEEVGKKLMERFVGRCVGDDVKGLHLMKAGDNIGTTIFYEKVGFKRWKCNMDGNADGIIGRKPGGAVCMVMNVEAEDVEAAYADVDYGADW